MNDQLLTTVEAAELVGISAKTIRYAAHYGTLRSIKRGGRRFIDRQDLLDYTRRRPLSDELFLAEWEHFTRTLGMSELRATEYIGSRYGLDAHHVQTRAHKLTRERTAA